MSSQVGKGSSGIQLCRHLSEGFLERKVDTLSRSPAYTFREGGTTAITEKPALGPDQWIEIGAMEIYDDTLESIDIAALDIAPLSADQKEAIIQDARLDKEYIQLCNAVSKRENVDVNYTIPEDVLTWKGKIYVPKGMRGKVMRWEHDLNVAGQFGRDRTMELIGPNFIWPKIDDDVRQHCNECDNCQRTKVLRHAKQGLLNPLELPSKPWTHIATDFNIHLPESEGCSKTLVVVDRFMMMAHFIPISKKDSPMMARAYMEDVWKYHRVPEDMVSDRDRMFSG